MKIILKTITLLFLLVLFFLGYLSTIGFETKKFNKQIINNISNINNNFKLELREIKIILNPFKFKLNIKTIGAKLKNQNETIEIEYLKTQIPLKSLYNNNFLIENLEISTKPVKVKSLISFIRVFQNKPELYLLEKIIKKGFLIADIKIDFDEGGKIKENFKINGIFKDTEIRFFKKYIINDINFNFNYKQKVLNLEDLSLNLNNLDFNSQKINIKNINNRFEIDGKIEAKELVLKDKNLDLFIKPYLKNLDIEKLKFSAINNFSFKIDEKFKFNDFNLISKVELDEFILLNKLKLKKFLPQIEKNLKLTDHKLEIDYGKKGLMVKGSGDIFLQNYKDQFDYLVYNKDGIIDFKTSIEIKKNPLLINFLNYEKKEKNNFILKLQGKKNLDNEVKFDTILVEEKDNKIKIEKLVLDKDFKVIDLNKAEINFLDKEGKKNKFNIAKKNNTYFLKGSTFNANSLIQILIDDENKSDFINKRFDLDIMLKKLLVDNNHILKNFKGKLSFDNHKIINGNLIGNFSSNEKLKFTVQSNGDEKITTFFLGKAEAIISRYKFIKGFEEGMLDFYSSKKGDQSSSTLKIYNFKLKELPALTKLLTLASLQGIADVLSGEGIRFNEFEMNFDNKKNVMTINEIYAIGPAISILMNGYVEKNKLVSLRGTLVPATTINSVIGSIPILGKILVGSKTGEGVFGVSFKIKGPPKNLETTVNPIKTLTPRFITRTLEKIKKN